MAYRVKQSLKEASLPYDKELLQEMVNQHLEDDPNNKVRLVKKRKIKEIIGRSPNRMDALMLTHAEAEEPLEDVIGLASTLGMTPQQAVQYRQAIEAINKRQNQPQDYDVLDYFNSESSDYDPFS
jgi:hypothetical protein